MESEFDHGLKESESDLLPSKKNSSSDEELHDSSMETYHQIGTPFISYKTGSKKNRWITFEDIFFYTLVSFYFTLDKK